MANIDLTQYGITGTTEIVHNPSYDELFAAETDSALSGYEKGQVSELGAVNVLTGIYTGRSPKDKFQIPFNVMIGTWMKIQKIQFGGHQQIMQMTTIRFQRIPGKS